MVDGDLDLACPALVAQDHHRVEDGARHQLLHLPLDLGRIRRARRLDG
jgi:hypothetical protein